MSELNGTTAALESATPCPSWCDGSHETLTMELGDIVHTSVEMHFEGQLGGYGEVYALAEYSSDNGDGDGFVFINGVRLTPTESRRLAFHLRRLADFAEDR